MTTGYNMSTPDDKPALPGIDEEKSAVKSNTPASNHVDEKILKHSHDADLALNALQQFEGQVITLDEATNRRLLRTIDWHMMPLMCIVYGLNYLDSMILFLFPPSALHLQPIDDNRDNHIVCEHHGNGD